MTLNWTPNRPTQPGEYWLSLHPSMRASLAKELRMTPPPTLEVYGFGIGSIIAEFWWGENAIDDEFLDGALWSVRETPADPFAKQETMIRTIKGPCFDCDVRSCWCGWGDNDECACHSPMGERTASIPKLEPEQRPNVPPRMM